MCVTVNPLCQTWNSLGNCLTCYSGYILYNNACLIDQQSQGIVTVGSVDLPSSSQDPYCHTYKNKVCVQCATRTYLNPSTNLCTQVSANCKVWNTVTGACQYCYDGYAVTPQNGCQLIYPSVAIVTQQKSSLNTDANCNASDAQGNCMGCIFRYVLNITSRVCIKVSDQCATWNTTTALCTGCYGGYTLSTNGVCAVAY
jgi:hypothetical protein